MNPSKKFFLVLAILATVALFIANPMGAILLIVAIVTVVFALAIGGFVILHKENRAARKA